MDTTQNLLHSFLIVYFYQVENKLNTTNNGLETIKFQSEEANTDEHLKKYFQDFLLKHNDLLDIALKKLSPLRKAFSGAYFSQNLIVQSSHTQVCCGFQISLLQKLFSIKYFRRGLFL
jgi:hypothetical protein